MCQISKRKIDNLPFEYAQSLTTVVEVVGKSVAKREEIQAYLKACSKIGCSLKHIFAEMTVVYGSTNVSYDDMARRRKTKFESGLESIEMHPNQKGQSVTKLHIK